MHNPAWCFFNYFSAESLLRAKDVRKSDVREKCTIVESVVFPRLIYIVYWLKLDLLTFRVRNVDSPQGDESILRWTLRIYFLLLSLIDVLIYTFRRMSFLFIWQLAEQNTDIISRSITVKILIILIRNRFLDLRLL